MTSNTAPSTPIFKKSMENIAESTPIEKSKNPQPLPRSGTLENLSGSQSSGLGSSTDVKEKTESKKQKFTSKLKYFKKGEFFNLSFVQFLESFRFCR